MTCGPAEALDAAGFVLAGGRSSRMGRDKALVELQGRPLIARAVDLLRESGLSAAIAGACADLSGFACVVPDPQPDRGPLNGICAGLAATAAERAVFIPVDLPLLPSSLLVYLLRTACITGRAVTLCSVNGSLQTFPVVLRRDVMSELKAELDAGRAGCLAAFHAAAARRGESIHVLGAEGLWQAGAVSHAADAPPYRWFLNANVPDDLLRLGSGRVS